MLDDCSYLHLDSPRLVKVFKIYHQAMTLMASILLLIAFQGITLSQEVALKSKYSYSTPALDAAQQLYSQRKYPEALAAFEAIIAEAETQQNYEEVVYAMEKKALALRRLGRYDDVIRTMNSAIKLATEQLPRDHFLISKMYYTRGSTDHILRKYYDARSYMDTALVFYNNASTYDSTAHYRIMEYKYYAYQYSEGSADTLLKYLDRLVEFEMADRNSIAHNKVLNLLQGYPEIYMQKGDSEQALAQAIRGYKYAKENRELVSNRYFAEAQLHLARVLYYKKDYAKALEIALAAMPLVESTPRNQMPEYYSFNNLIGISYMAKGNYYAALPYLNKAITIPVNEGNVFQKRDKAQFYSRVLGSLGLCYVNLGDLPKGKSLLDESLVYMKETIAQPSPDFHGNYDRLGDYYAREAKWSEALLSYDSALRNGLSAYLEPIDIFPSNDNEEYSYTDMQTLSKKATAMKRVALSEKEPTNLLLASKNYVATIHDLLIQNRKTFLASEGKLFLSENFKRLYETGVDICFELYKKTGDRKYFLDAFDFTQKSKSLLFLEQSEEFSLVNSQLLSQDLKQLFFESKTVIESLQSDFYKLIDISVKSDSVISINEKLLKAREDNKELKDSISRILSEFNESEDLFVSQTDGESSLPSKTGLIEFFYGENSLYVLAKSNKKFSFQKLDLSSEFTEALESLITFVSRPPDVNNFDSQVSSFVQNSSLIYELLLKQVLNDIGEGLEHLIIVPDEFLSRLPFEVLIAGEKPKSYDLSQFDYLIKYYSLQYELSSQMLLKRKRRKGLDGLLAIGFKSSGVSSGRSELGSLPGTEKEIQYLKSNVKGTYMMGENGTKEDFLQEGGEYDILHLAVHGKADDINRYESSLIFNGSGDNVLNTNDLYLANLNARLVVLSACESGTGRLNKGEGTFSIARGFAIVGVPSVIMSLWKVNDNVTSELMVDMYQGFLDEGLPINESLRRSKLAYIERNDAYSAHPYYWAAFLHLGENTELNPSNSSKLRYYIPLFILIGLVFLTLTIKKRKRAK